MHTTNYHDEMKQKETIYLRKIIKELPPFASEFFIGTSQTTSVKTRLGYARDLKIFFEYILENKEEFNKKSMQMLNIDDLDKIESEDIEIFIEYITYYTKKDSNSVLVTFQNDEKGKARKLATLRSIYKFFCKKKKITSNPAAMVDTPKIHQKNIIKLEKDEVRLLLNEAEYGNDLTKSQKHYHKYTKKRDLAIITLLLGTGMRVSECVGININDIDFKTNSVKITRKGGNQSVLYFGDEVNKALSSYIEQRNEMSDDIQDKDAFFISMQKRRITVRAIENLVKKYSNVVIPFKNISPHKLRSTYGTNLYNETGDIYLVADVLGHSDVNTTKKHYAQIEEERRKSAAKYIKLREE